MNRSEDTQILAQRLADVRNRIAQACAHAQRDRGTVALLAVSKTFGAERVIPLAHIGQRDFAENYLQESLSKIETCRGLGLDLIWHFIGPIQSNKTRPIAEQFDWVHSVERLRIATRLSEQRPPTLPPLNVCIQVNVSGETSKSGCAPQESVALALAVAAECPRLCLRGLMAIPEPTTDVALQRQRFAMLRDLHKHIGDQLPAAARAAFDTLSMGMSDDLEAAIAEGSTMVRVGTAIFGRRADRPTEPS
ncbi:MAG: putative enzyme [Pseudomonadota bacterium]|jgi:pyridoxal phosphate enzyme (YggS family)